MLVHGHFSLHISSRPSRRLLQWAWLPKDKSESSHAEEKHDLQDKPNGVASVRRMRKRSWHDITAFCVEDNTFSCQSHVIDCVQNVSRLNISDLFKLSLGFVAFKLKLIQDNAPAHDGKKTTQGLIKLHVQFGVLCFLTSTLAFTVEGFTAFQQSGCSPHV